MLCIVFAREIAGGEIYLNIWKHLDEVMAWLLKCQNVSVLWDVTLSGLSNGFWWFCREEGECFWTLWKLYVSVPPILCLLCSCLPDIWKELTQTHAKALPSPHVSHSVICIYGKAPIVCRPIVSSLLVPKRPSLRQPIQVPGAAWSISYPLCSQKNGAIWNLWVFFSAYPQRRTLRERFHWEPLEKILLRVPQGSMENLSRGFYLEFYKETLLRILHEDSI